VIKKDPIDNRTIYEKAYQRATGKLANSDAEAREDEVAI